MKFKKWKHCNTVHHLFSPLVFRTSSSTSDLKWTVLYGPSQSELCAKSSERLHIWVCTSNNRQRKIDQQPMIARGLPRSESQNWSNHMPSKQSIFMPDTHLTWHPFPASMPVGHSLGVSPFSPRCKPQTFVLRGFGFGRGCVQPAQCAVRFVSSGVIRKRGEQTSGVIWQ